MIEEVGYRKLPGVKNRAKIMALLPGSVKELAARSGLGHSTTKNHVRKLLEEGKIHVWKLVRAKNARGVFLPGDAVPIYRAGPAPEGFKPRGPGTCKSPHTTSAARRNPRDLSSFFSRLTLSTIDKP